jgi:hypothetical protein
VTALASADRHATGLEISATAIAAANERLQQLVTEGYPHLSQTSFAHTNFFELDTTSEDSKYDFVYDYTFLCALNPSIRNDWAKKMREVIKPGGELLTLIFPIIEKEGGPPYGVSLELVRGLLEPEGFECLELSILPPALCHAGRDGSPGSMGQSGVGRWRLLRPV